MSEYHRAFHYRCQQCGKHERLMYLEVGLEDGEPHLPVPFMVGRCVDCNGFIEHTDWQRDQSFEPPISEIPADAPYFAFPNRKERRRLGAQACGVPSNRPIEWMGKVSS